MTFDPVSYSEIKKLGKPIVKSSAPPSSTDVIWYDETTNCYRGFNEKTNQWNIVSKFGVDWFDNCGAGTWTDYIEIPIQTTPTEDIQYLIEINGTTVSVYSNDLTTTLVSSKISTFWSEVKESGNDIRVFDETFGQNYFWIEEFDYTNQKCKIWVKLNAGQELIGITFGNPYAENSLFNDGEQTFEFFDDFDGTSLDTNKWTEYQTPTITISNSVLTMSVSTAEYGIYTETNLNLGYIVDIKQQLSSGGEDSGLYFGNEQPGNAGKGYLFHKGGWGNTVNRIYQGWWVTTQLASVNYTFDNNYHIISHIIYDNGLILIIDGSKNLSYSGTISENITYLGIHQYTGCTWNYDWVRVRKYISSDLTFGTPTLKSF